MSNDKLAATFHPYTAPTGCQECDLHGPELPTLEADQRNLHRALHGMFLAIATTLRIDKLAGALDRWLTRKETE